MKTSTKKSFVVEYLFQSNLFEENIMPINILRRSVWMVSLGALLIFGLILTACGGAATPTAEAPAPTEEVAEVVPPAEDTPVTEEEPEPTDTPEEEAVEEAPTEVTAEPESAASDQGGTAACVPADPNTDPLTGAILFLDEYIDTGESNSSISPVTEADWAKGDADAPITIIEYGDFQ
jgi:outer membrane biosynthesis protein TonB